MGQISSNLLKKAFATWRHAVLSTSTMFSDSFALAWADFSGRENDLPVYLLAFHLCISFYLLLLFVRFLFLLFLSFCYSHWPSNRLASSSKKIWESIMETGKLYHGVASCSHRQFCSEFFTQISEHFCGYFRLHWADHSDLVKSLERLFPAAELKYRWCKF